LAVVVSFEVLDELLLSVEVSSFEFPSVFSSFFFSDTELSMLSSTLSSVLSTALSTLRSMRCSICLSVFFFTLFITLFRLI
jgi:hypothetical protein